MSMRVTNFQAMTKFIDQINTQKLSLEQTRQQLSSGVKAQTPGDDPGNSATIETFNRTVNRLEAHKERIIAGVSFMEVQEATLNSAQSVLIRSKELATQAANETLSREQRANMAVEVWELRDALVGLANTKYRGVYVYGGLDDDDPPFDDTPAGAPGTPGYTNSLGATHPSSKRYVYDGEDGTALTREIVISDTDKIRINTQGDAVFQEGIAALERLGRALDGLYTTPTDLSTYPDGGGAAMTFPGDYAAQTSDILETIDLIDTSLTGDISQELMSIGSRVNKLEQAREIADSVQMNTISARSGIQDIDLYEAASQFTAAQTTLEALLNAGVKMNSLSIMNFI